MKKLLAFLLVLAMLFSLTACTGGEVNYEGNYKELTEEEYDTLMTTVREQLKEEEVETQTANGYRIWGTLMAPSGSSTMAMTLDYKLTDLADNDVNKAKASVEMHITSGEESMDTNAYLKEGFMYASMLGGKYKIAIDSLVDFTGSMQFDTKDLLEELDFLDDTYAELKEEGITISVAKSLGQVKIRIDMAQDSPEAGIMQGVTGYESYIVVVLNSKGFVGLKVYSVYTYEGQEYKTEIKMEPYDGKVEYPEDLDTYETMDR